MFMTNFTFFWSQWSKFIMNLWNLSWTYEICRERCIVLYKRCIRCKFSCKMVVWQNWERGEVKFLFNIFSMLLVFIFTCLFYFHMHFSMLLVYFHMHSGDRAVTQRWSTRLSLWHFPHSGTSGWTIGNQLFRNTLQPTQHVIGHLYSSTYLKPY